MRLNVEAGVIFFVSLGRNTELYVEIRTVNGGKGEQRTPNLAPRGE